MLKFLKRSAWIIVGVIVLLVIIGFLLPTQRTVEKSITIETPLRNAFEQVNNLQNWKDWSPWKETAPTMQLSYSNPPSGSSAFLHWQHPQSKSNHGRILLGEVDSYRRIDAHFEKNKKHVRTIVFRFNETEGGVELKMETSTESGWMPWDRYAGLFWQNKTRREFKHALQGIRSRLEIR